MSTFFDDDDGEDDFSSLAPEHGLAYRVQAGQAGQAGPARVPQQANARAASHHQNDNDVDGAALNHRQRAAGKARTAARGVDDDAMDVDDLLRRAGVHPDAHHDGVDRLEEDETEGRKETDVQALMRHWMDERAAPELLHLHEDRLTRVMENVEAQAQAVELLSTHAAAKPEEHERILLVQLELERVRYLLRAYLRTRTYKIEMFAQYLLTTPGARAKLSEVELGYAERYQALVEKHFTQSVTQNLPDRLQRLDEDEMIIRPDLDQAVFARARRDCPPITLPDGQSIQMRAGDTHMLRYRSIRRLLRDGDVRLV